MLNDFINLFKEYLGIAQGFFVEYTFLGDLVFLTLMVVLSLILYTIVSKLLLKGLKRLVEKSKTHWDDVLLNPVFIRRVSFLVPVYVMHELATTLTHLDSFVETITEVLVVLYIVLSLTNLLNSVSKLLEGVGQFKNRPIKGYIQVINIVIYIWGIILIVGLVSNQSLGSILGGLSALTAIIILVFRDTILSFVASIQISSYDLVKEGDWIEVPKFGADGDVVDISLNVIKVQNWDKTITVIPTYKLVEESFKNWRYMSLAGGRRIKRSVNIDLHSIKFLDVEMLKKLKKIDLLKEYLAKKELEVEDYNKNKVIDPEELVNQRRLTNLGTFRAYLLEYLKVNEKLHSDMISMVRQLKPDAHGVPIEIYVFSKTVEWVEYEGVQADIFDHILAIIPEFGLSVYQEPSGADFRQAFNKPLPEHSEDNK